MDLLLYLRRVWHGMRDLEYRVLVFATVLHFALFYAVLAPFEASDAPILQPVNYWYYWATTVLTIGYGDLSPQSFEGRLVAPLFEFSGILILAAWLTKAGNGLTEYASRKRRGLMQTHHTGHVLVIGDYDPVDTERLIESALRDVIDDGVKASAVCCFRNCGDQHPLAGGVAGIRPDYVQASSGFSLRTLRDAGAQTASSIYISCTDDTTGIGIACALSRLGITVPVALILRQDESVDTVPTTDLDLRLVPPVQSALAVRAVQDPGTDAVIRELISVGEGKTIFSLRLPIVPTHRDRFGAVESAFRTMFGSRAMLIGFVRENTGQHVPCLLPPSDRQLRDGDCLIYIADKDLHASEERDFNLAVAA